MAKTEVFVSSPMISHVEIENWRSLEKFDMSLDPLTALVGANGAGKTAVLHAIDLLLGNRWPSMASFNLPRDFCRMDTSLGIRIRCTFDPPLQHVDALSKDQDIAALEFRCQPYKRKTATGDVGDLHDDFYPLNAKGEQPMVATVGPRKVRRSR